MGDIYSGLSCSEFNGHVLVDEPAHVIMDMLQRKLLSGVCYIVTPNADHFCRLDSGADFEFFDAYKNADLRICDSRIIQKLSRFESRPIRNVVPGSDLTRHILESQWIKDFCVLIVGPSKSDAEVIKARYSLSHLHSYSPTMGFIKSASEVAKCVDVINSSSADIVFLAVGSPQQEILANRVKQSFREGKGSPKVILCVGASFDFLSGKSKRAPRIMQLMHLEWLHRALKNPSRLIPRYWNNFLWILTYLTERNKK